MNDFLVVIFEALLLRFGSKPNEWGTRCVIYNGVCPDVAQGLLRSPNTYTTIHIYTRKQNQQ